MKIFLNSIYTLIVLATITITSYTIGFGQDAGDVNEGGKGIKVIRIGVVMPRVKLKEATGEIDPSAALRNTYAVLLKSETTEIIALDARLSSLALEEAAKKECDYILNLSLDQKEKKKGGGMFGRVVRSTGKRATYETASKVPYGGGAGERVARTAAHSAIINTGYTISNMNIKVTKSDKFTLVYNMITAKGKNVLNKTITGKAKKNNDDKVLMGLIEESGNDIISAIRKETEKAD